MPRAWRMGEIAEVTIQGDSDRLGAALDVLLENAVAHTGAGDRVELSVRAECGQAVLAVADSGCGIAEADQQRIFDRFARASPYRGREADGLGLGLGLPIVAAIAEAHHGSVLVHSAIGAGARFELLIPAAPVPGSVSRPPLPLPGPSSPHKAVPGTP